MSQVSDSERRESERIGAAIRSAVEGIEAPTALRNQIARDDRREPVNRRRWIAVPVLGVLLAAVITSVTLLALGSGGGPTLADAAGLALRAPTQAAPPSHRGDERFLRAEVGGVHFPNYRYSTPYRTAGARSDELHGRHALTVVYGLGDKRIGYTIVDGKPLSVPSGARRVTRKGLRVAILRRHGARVVTWREGGHTCVLASRSASLQRLVAWAAWS
ncbi:MAG TPA: hypothetical protein VIM03_00200 [Thermoleophilaceae bacterium]|jgi:hypothetical protein